jgi:hypothetical protein
MFLLFAHLVYFLFPFQKWWSRRALHRNLVSAPKNEETKLKLAV